MVETWPRSGARCRSWPLRPRDCGRSGTAERRLPREAYERIGGVVGALAQHAEQGLTRLGRSGKVSSGRSSRTWSRRKERERRAERDLLSVFGEGRDGGRRSSTPSSTRASSRVRSLGGGARPRGLGRVGATPVAAASGEDAATARTRRRRVEIVHESLLTHWPRLVRWQTQDADGALLRDQLRQAARLWDEKSRPDDLLWTGASHLEYRAWRARYPGGLSTVEEDRRGHDARANRQRRRRRTGAMAALAVAAAVALATSALWRRSEAARDTAERETRRAEASGSWRSDRSVSTNSRPPPSPTP